MCHSAEGRPAALSSDPHLTSHKQWPFSHYVPTSRPLAGPFPRPFTNLTAQPQDLPADTFQERVNDDEKEKNMFILWKVISQMLRGVPFSIRRKFKDFFFFTIHQNEILILILTDDAVMRKKKTLFVSAGPTGSSWTAEPCDTLLSACSASGCPSTWQVMTNSRFRFTLSYTLHLFHCHRQIRAEPFEANTLSISQSEAFTKSLLSTTFLKLLCVKR